MSGVEWFFAIDDSIALDEYINKKNYNHGWTLKLFLVFRYWE